MPTSCVTIVVCIVVVISCSRHQLSLVIYKE